MLEIEIRVPRRTAALALAGGLLCLLWRFSLSQRMDNMWSGNPAGAYSGVTVTGVNAAGPVNTILAANPGNMVRLASASGSGNQAKLFSATPLMGIATGGGSLPSSPTPMGAGGPVVTFNSRGTNSGVGFATQASPLPGVPNAFRMYPYGNTLAINYNDNGDASAAKFTIDSSGFHIACQTVIATWGTVTSCPAGSFALGDMAQNKAIDPGEMICCPIGLKQ